MVDYGYHFIQSFNGKEVSSEECNDIGVELAESLWGDKYQVLVCTHVDKDNVHNHIILNSVSFVDGSKYHNSKVELALVRQTNDDLCRKYGLSVIETEKAEKEEYIKLYNHTQNNANKTILKAKISHLNEDIERMNIKLQTCRRIISKTEKGSKEEKLIQKRIEENKEKSEKDISKKKDRIK